MKRINGALDWKIVIPYPGKVVHPSLFTDKNQKLTPNQFTRRNNIYVRDAQSGGLTPFRWVLSILYQETGWIKNNWLLFFTRLNNKQYFVDLMTGSSSSVNASGSYFPTILSSLCKKSCFAKRWNKFLHKH